MNLKKILFKSTALFSTLFFFAPSVLLAAEHCSKDNPCACCVPIKRPISAQIMIHESMHHYKNKSLNPGFEHHKSLIDMVMIDIHGSEAPQAGVGGFFTFLGAKPSEAYPTSILMELRRVSSSLVIPRLASRAFAKEGKEPFAVKCCVDDTGNKSKGSDTLLYSNRYMKHGQVTVFLSIDLSTAYKDKCVRGFKSGIFLSQISDPIPLYLQHQSILC